MQKESRTIENRPGTMDPVKQPKIENQDWSQLWTSKEHGTK